MKIFKKSMCLLLAVVMVLGMAITASAVETTETMSVTASKANPAVGEEFSIYLNASGDIAECGCFHAHFPVRSGHSVILPFSSYFALTSFT